MVLLGWRAIIQGGALWLSHLARTPIHMHCGATLGHLSHGPSGVKETQNPSDWQHTLIAPCSRLLLPLFLISSIKPHLLYSRESKRSAWDVYLLGVIFQASISSLGNLVGEVLLEEGRGYALLCLLFSLSLFLSFAVSCSPQPQNNSLKFWISFSKYGLSPLPFVFHPSFSSRLSDLGGAVQGPFQSHCTLTACLWLLCPKKK